MSQIENFIKREDWSSYQVNEELIFTCFLSPDFSGQDESIAVKGKGEIRRFDLLDKCVAVEFIKSFRQFESSFDESRRMGY